MKQKKGPNKTFLESLIEDAKGSPEFIAERAAISFIEQLLAIMERSGMSRSTLAEKSGMDPAVISRCFSGGHNMTIRTMARLASAVKSDIRINLGLDERVQISISEPKRESAGLTPTRGNQRQTGR